MNSVPHITQYETYTLQEITILVGAILFGNIPLYFYAYFNIQGINFKKYLKDIMSGCGIIELYDNDASIFIYKSNLKASRSVCINGISMRSSNYTEHKSLLNKMLEETDESVLKDDYKANYLAFIHKEDQIRNKRR